MNEFSLKGEIIHVDPIRYTPVGIPLKGFRVKHESQQSEAKLLKKVFLEINCIVAGEQTKVDLQLGDRKLFKGFLEKRSQKSNQVVFHITHIELDRS
ncbi:MAG: primosomal replication protein N [Methylophilaceae bacterium]